MGQLFSQGARESPNETGMREYTRHIVIEKGKLENKRVVVIGDVHGCLDELISLLDKCEYDPNNDQVVFVGDLVNKGPQSAEVVKYVHQLPDVLCVRGNHDEALLQQLKKPASLRPSKYSYATKLSRDDIDWLHSLPFTITLEDVNAIIVHAGLVPGKPLLSQSTDNMTKMRNIKDKGNAEYIASESASNGGEAWSKVWKGPQHVYFGHDAVRGLQKFPHATGLDTGCCYGRALTAVILPDYEFIEVPALKVHQKPGGTVWQAHSRARRL